jgi:hypothetical protein
MITLSLIHDERGDRCRDLEITYVQGYWHNALRRTRIWLDEGKESLDVKARTVDIAYADASR